MGGEEMKNIVLVLIVLFAIIGMSSAASRPPIAKIYSPEDGGVYDTNTEIELDTMYRGSGNEEIYTRILLDGEPYLSSTLMFEIAGEHTIVFEVAKNPEFANPIQAKAKITIVEPE